jgi:hypothetical protein
LTGSKGFANKYPISGFTFLPGQIPSEILKGATVEAQKIDLSKVDPASIPEATLNPHSFVSAEVQNAILQAYKHPIHREIEETAKKVGGHGGMDFVMDYRLVYCLQNGLPLDQDVYDAAEWSCIGELSATSAKHNSMPVAVPDFTRGDWNKVQGLKFHMKK